MSFEDLPLISKDYCKFGDYMRAATAQIVKQREEFICRAPFMRPEQRKVEQKALAQMEADFNYKILTSVFASEKWLIHKSLPNDLDKFTVFSFEEVDRVIKDQAKLRNFKSLLLYAIIKEARHDNNLDSVLKGANIKYIWIEGIK